MNFDYYLFDLDNCLIHYPDFMDIFDKILVSTLNNFSAKIPDKEERDTLWSAGTEYNNILKKWGISNFNDFWKIFDENDFKYRKKLIKKGGIYLYHDVEQVLKKLNTANKKLALVSNSPQYIVDFFVKELELNSSFQEILGIDYEIEPTIAKPSPKGIKNILKLFNFNSKTSSAIMVGDSIIDILAAKRAKINACLIKRDLNKYSSGYDDWEYKPDFVIESLNEVLRLKKK